MPVPSPETISSLLSRWEQSGASEKANYAIFLTELCDQILQVPHPEPARPDNTRNLYVFERAVTHKHPDGNTAIGYLDLYKAGCFVLETKQATTRKRTIPEALRRRWANSTLLSQANVDESSSSRDSRPQILR